MKIPNAKSIIFKRLAPSCIALIGVVLGVSASTSSHAALIQITSIPGITLGAPNGGLGNGAELYDIPLFPGGGQLGFVTKPTTRSDSCKNRMSLHGLVMFTMI